MLVSSVEMRVVGYVKIAHKLGEITPWSFQHQVKVVVHKNITMKNDSVGFLSGLENI